MSQARHDAAWWQLPDQSPTLLVVFSSGPDCAKDEQLLPSLAKALSGFSG
jgi:hypothetical protein